MTAQPIVLIAYIAGVLHILAAILSDFAQEGLFQTSIGLIWIAIAAGSQREMRWLQWLAFYFAMAAAIMPLYRAVNPTFEPDWLYTAIFIVDTLVAVLLFYKLWAQQKDRII